jgi:hypothetical protein
MTVAGFELMSYEAGLLTKGGLKGVEPFRTPKKSLLAEAGSTIQSETRTIGRPAKSRRLNSRCDLLRCTRVAEDLLTGVDRSGTFT